MLRRVLHSLVSNPKVYDVWQRAVGSEENIRRVRQRLTDMKGGIVLDAGAGTGEGLRSLPASAKYLWFDTDPQKLAGFRAKAPSALAVIGDATNIGLKDKSVHCTICLQMSHHLTDSQLTGFFREAARISRMLVFVDAVEQKNSWLRTTLWKYDRGSFPRSAETLATMMARYFKLEHQESYSKLYKYVLFVGIPTQNS